jgi:hypothetical protein
VMALAGFVILALCLLRRRARDLVPLAAAAAVSGAAFYLRNLVEFGNPLYPVALRIGPVQVKGTVAAGDFTNNPPQFASTPKPFQFLQNLWYSMTNPPPGYTHDVRVGGFGRVAAVVVALLIVGIIVSLVRRPPGTLGRVAPVLVTLLVVLVVQPQPWYPRYTIVPFMLLAVLGAMLLDVFDGPGSAVVALVILAIAVGLFFNDEQRMFHGLPQLDRDARAIGSDWNTGSTGATTAYGAAWKFLSGQPCGTRVGMIDDPGQVGGFSLFNLPAWGEQLCNHVETLPRRSEANGPLISDLAVRQALRSDRFLIVPRAMLDHVRSIASDMQITVMDRGRWVIDRPEDQVVLQIDP